MGSLQRAKIQASAARHPAAVLAVLALIVIMLAMVASRSIFAQDQTQNGTVEMDGNVANDTAAGTDWGPGPNKNSPTLQGICQATGVLGPDGNGYIASAPLPPGIITSLCKGDSYLTTLDQASILNGKAFGTDQTYFSSNKDIQDIQSPIAGVSGIWGCNAISNPTPKDEILNAYAALGTVANGPNTGNTSLYVGFERGTNNGTAFQGVWFLQRDVACTSPATGSANFSCPVQTGQSADCHTAWTFNTSTTPWTVTHTGDILLLVNFTGGGSNTTVQMYAWAPSVANRPQDAFPLLLLDGQGGVPFNATGSDCQDSTSVNSGTAICATTNNPAFNPTTPTNGCIVTAWPPANQSACVTGASGKTTDTGGTAILDELQFYEGMVNLNKVFGTIPCFSQALFEARSSAQPTATLKDYALGNFNTCGTIIVHKETDPDNANHAFSYTTTGGSNLSASFNLTDDGNNVNGCDYNQSTATTADDCGTTGTAVFQDITPSQTYTVTETDPSTGTPPFDFVSLNCVVDSGNATVTTSGRTATIQMGALGVVECQYNNRQRGTIEILKQDEGGNPLTGACFTVSPNTTGGTAQFVVCDRTTTSSQTGNFANDGNTSPGVICLTNMIFGSYNVSETTVPPGYAGGPDQTATVNSTASCGNGTVLTFVNKLGTILITKVSSKTGNPPVGGACFDISPNPKPGGSGTFTVCDQFTGTSTTGNFANDTDTAKGSICVTGVLLNASGASYTLHESTVPANYKGAADQTVSVTTASTNCSGDTANQFVNTPLSQIEVKFFNLTGETSSQITCQDASNSVIAPQSENGSADSTPPTFDDTDELYGNTTSTLVPGTYTCTVNIDP